MCSGARYVIYYMQYITITFLYITIIITIRPTLPFITITILITRLILNKMIFYELSGIVTVQYWV